MMLNLGRDLPLIFHEGGVDTLYRGAHRRPLRIPTAALRASTEGISLEPYTGAEPGHVALFAAFMSKRTKSPVNFEINDVRVNVDTESNGAEPEGLSEEFMASVAERFETIDGIGTISLGEAAEIVQSAQVAVETYQRGLRSKFA